MARPIEEVIEKYPIGSKLVGRLVGYDSDSRELVCKVVGYSYYTNQILVYNPNIKGHCGNSSCWDGEDEVEDEVIGIKYGNHCWYVDFETLSGW